MPSAATVYQTLNLSPALASAASAAACSVTSCCRMESPRASPIRGTPPPHSQRAPSCASPPHAGRPGASCSPVAEAATIGAWAVTGTEKAADLGIASLSAVLLGVISAVGGGAIRDVVVLSRVPEVFGGNTLTATCAAASAVVMIIAYRLHHPAAGLACGTAIGGALYLVARWRHWVLPSAARLRPPRTTGSRG